ncbi:hypothetical protein K32_48880 [Kaistia sp. 32K]|uniref:DUF2493 domain-containing protein n=1 Tax=Kaistia sp. 32K TaxID=2795690 RepID=UPI0019152EA2|nr:DUF2493 domain-containing protein [Kaistia sp. 32K]BCP56271.1 hypothetical protein K32_48880 [Kaistia sp. 32K]
MKLLVCGGRDFMDRNIVFEVLDGVHAKRRIEVIIHGCARGADRLAGQWAKARGVLCAEVEAHWAAHGKGAGPRRNRAMLSLGPDGVVAFPGGDGTLNMIRIAEEAGIKVWLPCGMPEYKPTAPAGR